MPVPGPRTQQRPLPGYTNPDGDLPDRTNLWLRPGPISSPGRSPATMILNLRGNRLAPGQIRTLWRQTANMIAAQAPYSWTDSAPAPGAPVATPPGLDITRAIRYMTRSVYAQEGTDNSRFAALHTQIEQRHNYKPVTVNAGTVRNRPTIRNRLTSFGSRVPSLNSRVSAAASDDQ